jgi:hypothetical protein
MPTSSKSSAVSDTPKVLLRIPYKSSGLWVGFMIFILLTLLCIWGVYLVIEPDNFSVHATDFLQWRRRRFAIWLFRVLPEPVRMLVMLSLTVLFGTCTVAISRLLWLKAPHVELRSDGILSNTLFKRRFDAWQKIRLMAYEPSYDKKGCVSHSFRVILPQYGMAWWDHHIILLTANKARFDPETVRAILHKYRPDLLPDLFLAENRQGPAEIKSPRKNQMDRVARSFHS